jgi:hypothetical protein
MSKRHPELLQIFNNTEAETDRIWKIALDIWKGILSAMIARAFFLAYRITGKITEIIGDTDWLKNGAPHCNVRRDFLHTDKGIGIKKITDYVDVGDDATGAFQSYSPTSLNITLSCLMFYSHLISVAEWPIMVLHWIYYVRMAQSMLICLFSIIFNIYFII